MLSYSTHLARGPLRAPVASPTPWHALGLEPRARQRTVPPVHHGRGASKRPETPWPGVGRPGPAPTLARIGCRQRPAAGPRSKVRFPAGVSTASRSTFGRCRTRRRKRDRLFHDAGFTLSRPSGILLERAFPSSRIGALTALDRRQVMRGMIAGAATLALPRPAVPAMDPILPPLPPHTDDRMALLLQGIARHEAPANDAERPEPVRMLFQHCVTYKQIILEFPHPDAISQIRPIAER